MPACGYCNRYFTHRSSLSRHRKTVHCETSKLLISQNPYLQADVERPMHNTQVKQPLGSKLLSTPGRPNGVTATKICNRQTFNNLSEDVNCDGESSDNESRLKPYEVEAPSDTESSRDAPKFYESDEDVFGRVSNPAVTPAFGKAKNTSAKKKYSSRIRPMSSSQRKYAPSKGWNEYLESDSSSESSYEEMSSQERSSNAEYSECTQEEEICKVLCPQCGQIFPSYVDCLSHYCHG